MFWRGITRRETLVYAGTHSMKHYLVFQKVLEYFISSEKYKIDNI